MHLKFKSGCGSERAKSLWFSGGIRLTRPRPYMFSWKESRRDPFALPHSVSHVWSSLLRREMRAWEETKRWEGFWESEEMKWTLDRQQPWEALTSVLPYMRETDGKRKGTRFFSTWGRGPAAFSVRVELTEKYCRGGHEDRWHKRIYLQCVPPEWSCHKTLITEFTVPVMTLTVEPLPK